MKLIEKLCEMVDEEIEDAEKYAKLALKYKDERPALAKTFYDLSTDELRHQKLLHGEVVAVIDEYTKQNGAAPAGMKALYDYLHETQIERVREVKRLQEMSREG